MERHLIAYYIGIVILFAMAIVPLVTGVSLLGVVVGHGVNLKQRSLVLLTATLLVAYQFTYSQGMINW